MMTIDEIFRANCDLAKRLKAPKAKGTGKKRKHPEADFQKSIIQLAALEYPAAEVIAIPNRTNSRMIKTKSGKWISVEGKNLKAMGQRAGAGDLLWLWDNFGPQYGFMEIKWDAAQEQAQKDFEAAILRVKGRYEICRKQLERVHEICALWGVPRRIVR